MKKLRALSVTELMVTVLIASILIGASIPLYSKYLIRSKFAEIMVVVTYHKEIFGISYTDENEFPSSVDRYAAGTATPSSYALINDIEYNRSTDKQKAYLHFYTANLGIPGYVSSGSDGSGGTSSRFTLGLVVDRNGNTKVYCGQYDGSQPDIPLSYLPVTCKDTNISAAVS